MSGKPLQALNSVQINAKSNAILRTPGKGSVGKPERHHHHRKQKLSALCKTPPSVVRTRNGRGFHRGLFLGEGGFARCFQMKDESGQIFAAKTVAKASIKNEKTKTKLLSEIKIHKSMSHPNVVKFIDCFEDDVNVYILLEMCPHQTLMDLLKHRKLLSEPEVRFFMAQIVGAVKYLHRRMVVHRDLKLGNVFFDPDMNLKIGDFGLATVISAPGKRRYTICGTPNYIAPEVLGGKKVGHSFEVDIWAIGIMMFALLFGKPPFQAKDVQVIYQRIKHDEYRFPEGSEVSQEARQLIRDMLKHNPEERPTLDEILEYPWFTSGPFPAAISTETLKRCPKGFSFITKEESMINFERVKGSVGLAKSTKTTTSSAAPVEILKSDLHSDRARTLLPHSLSPDNNKNKYREVNPVNVKPYRAESNKYESRMVQVMNESLSRTLMTVKQIEEGTSKPDPSLGDEDPVLVSKWVDYSNKHGFAYQLSTKWIGVLFNAGHTLLRNSDTDSVALVEPDVNLGWRATTTPSVMMPAPWQDDMKIVLFFQDYMNDHLSDVAKDKSEGEQEVVYLRRYTRQDGYIMFEMSNGTYQFNFKDHHKYVLSHYGQYLTHITPDKQVETLPLNYVVENGNFYTYRDDTFGMKYDFVKRALRDKVVM